jgi:fructose-1,6-bisphosphatase/inositol monophosphatase family enzyme
MNPSSEIITDSLEAVQSVFRSFRATILERAGNTEYISKQGDGSPVTASDLEIELALQARLKILYPDMPVYGEETGYGGNMPGTYWLIDPIDGTKAFIEGMPTFTCMAVLIQNGEAIASLIYNPSSDDTYTARLGAGAYKNGQQIDLAAVPIPHEAICKSVFINELNAILKPVNITCKESPTGGGFGFTLVLDGLAAARFNMHSAGHTHDYAPGGLLVREAGGVLLPILEDEYTFETRSFVACHPRLETVLRPHLAQLRALETS